MLPPICLPGVLATSSSVLSPEALGLPRLGRFRVLGSELRVQGQSPARAFTVGTMAFLVGKPGASARRPPGGLVACVGVARGWAVKSCY